jgi:hypothetical protein
VSADVILGMPWLYSLGRFECDMRMNELSFTSKTGHGTRRIVLGGQPNAPKLENSKVLPFGKAVTEMRAAVRLLKTEEGPTVEQVRATIKAIRQPGEELYGYDHEDDPRSHINPAWLLNHPGAPLCYLCYLLPSRDVEDIKGETGLDSSKPSKKPHILEEKVEELATAEADGDQPQDAYLENETSGQKPKPQAPQSTAKAAQTGTTWDLPIPGVRTPWDTISTTDKAEKTCLELVTSALDDRHATPGQVQEATTTLEKLVRSRKTPGDTF